MHSITQKNIPRVIKEVLGSYVRKIDIKRIIKKEKISVKLIFK